MENKTTLNLQTLQPKTTINLCKREANKKLTGLLTSMKRNKREKEPAGAVPEVVPDLDGRCWGQSR